MTDNVILRFSNVSFSFGQNKHILDEANFSVRTGSRITLMGQNGAGKSTLFKLISGELKPTSGNVVITPSGCSMAVAKQVMPAEALALTVKEFFITAFEVVPGNIDKRISEIFSVLNMSLPLTAKIKLLSGGQQARLLLAHALIQDPDILLLDEPTNNLDKAGLEHLTGFLMMYEKTVLVISHDAEFLNAFSDGVLYLDVFTHSVEQYSGNYFDVVEEIQNRRERENQQNARMRSQIADKLAQAEVFAHKGGKLRAVAKRMRENAQEAESEMVEVRREDKTIREFAIPCQEFETFFDGKIFECSAIPVAESGTFSLKTVSLTMRKSTHVLISGPNGIGKSTFLEAVAEGSGETFRIAKTVRCGYYKQDFTNLATDEKAFDCLRHSMQKFDEHQLRSTAAGFLLDGKLLDQPISALSEGQKGLLSFCRLVLLRPGLLILDEPTNHINFRHLPVIAKACNEYEGAMLLVSHIPEFISQIRIDQTIDLSCL